MKRWCELGLALCIALVGHAGGAEAVTDRTGNQPHPYQLAITQQATPKLTDARFVGDTDEYEAMCWYSDTAAGGSLSVVVNIDRAVGDVPTLIQQGFIDTLAIIHVALFDADGFANNRLSVNGHMLKQPIVSPNCLWQVHSDTIPVRWLKFPDKGQHGQAPDPEENRVRIDIELGASQPGYCLSVDWVAIEIKVARPLLFVHGILDGSGTWIPTYAPGIEEATGLPFLNNLSMQPPPIGLIQDNAVKIGDRVEQLKIETGSDKVNLICHSKGGLDARHYAGLSDDIEQIVQIGTPNCGAPLASLLIYLGENVENYTEARPLEFFNAMLGPGGVQLTIESMEAYNHGIGAYNLDVKYASIAAVFNTPWLFGWMKPTVNFFGATDGVVPVWSAHCITNFQNVVQMGTGTANDEMYHGNQPSSATIRDVAVAPILQTFGTSSVNEPIDLSQSTIAVRGDLREGQTTSGPVDLDAAVPTSVSLYYPSGAFNFTLQAPSGQIYTAASVAGDTAFTWADDELPGGRVESVSFVPPELGRWTIAVTAVDVVEPGNVAGFMAAAHFLNPPAVLKTFLPRPALAVGDTLVVVGTFMRNGSPATADSVRGVIVQPDGTLKRVIMLDNGATPDTTANDGRFTGSLIGITQSGTYRVISNAKGTSGGTQFSRASGAMASVTASRSTFLGVTGSAASDTDQNQLYDKLDVTVSFNITAAATYMIRGVLRDGEGRLHSAATQVALSAGVRAVTLSFNGEAIGDGRVDGPYSFVEVQMAEISSTAMMSRGTWASTHTTSAYLFRDFEHMPIKITGPVSSVAVSTSSQAGYEYLDVTIGIDVDEAEKYAWWGNLVDGQGIQIAGTSEGRGMLSPGGDEIVLRFGGPCIRRNGIDGPFYVKDLIIAGPRHAEFSADSFATSTHLADDFSQFGTLYSSAWVEDDSLSVCPAGDLDTLRMKLFIPHECGTGQITGPPPSVWARDNNLQYTATIWDAVTPTDPNGDSLYAYAYHPGAVQDTALFQASAISGCYGLQLVGFNNASGRLEFNFEVEGNPVEVAPLIALMNVDLDRRSFGTVDRFDSTRYAQMSVYTGPSQCSNLDWNTVVDSVDAAIFATHLGHRHHIGRRLVTPNGGERVAPGSPMSITWTAGYGDSAKVQLWLLRDQSTDTTAVATDEADDGAYSWTVPTTLPPGTQYRMEVAHTAGKYVVDGRTLGTDRSDTTFTIRPKPVTGPAVSMGRYSAALSWVEPGQAGGQADAYDIRYLMNGTLSEANWEDDGVEQVSGEPSPGAASTEHCIEIDSLSGCKSYSFGIRTWDNGAPSVLRVVNGNTPCSGFTMAICDGGGLMAGGGGGGEEGASALELASTSGDVQAVGVPNENSLLWWDGTGLEVTDLQRIATGGETRASYPVTVREIERRQTHLDLMRLGAVDHSPTRLALAGAGQVVVGAPGAVMGVRGSEGSVRISSETPYFARSGEVLEVELGPSRTDRALVLDTRRPLAGAKTDSLGIRVERELPDGTWARAAVVHPRREFDKFAIPAQGSPAMRVTFLGSYPIRAVEALEDVEVVMPTALTLSDAAHSRLGMVSPAIRDSGDTRTSLVPGDSLTLQFAATEIPAGMVRSLFLTAKGSYERLDGEEALDAPADRAVANEPILEFSLGAAYPNPSDGTVTIAYTLARQVPTVLRVYNVVGREVRTLVDQDQTAGRREALWDGRDNGGRKVSSGVYFYRLRAGAWQSERKLIVIQ